MPTEPTHVPQVVVGVDGSPSSQSALRWAARQTGLVGGTLHAVTAWTYPDLYGWGGVPEVDWAAYARGQQDSALLAALGADALPGVHRRVVEGPAVRVLVDAAADADLVVVGSRGHGGFAGMLLGSVSQHLVAHSPCPVVVVRTDTATATDTDQAEQAGRTAAAPHGPTSAQPA